MDRYNKLNEEIKAREGELTRLKEQLEINSLLDWKDKEGKYWLVESYPVQGKTHFYIYHIIEVRLNKMILEYVDLDSKYIARNEFDFVIEPCYMKWTKTTEKEFNEKCKGCEDLRIKEETSHK